MTRVVKDSRREILVDAAPSFALKCKKGCERCQHIVDYFEARRTLETDRKAQLAEKHGFPADPEVPRAKSVRKQVSLMAKEVLLAAWESTMGRWTFRVEPSSEHHRLILNDEHDLTELWNLFPDEKEGKPADPVLVRKRVFSRLKKHTELPEQKVPLPNQRRNMVRYCESARAEPDESGISGGTPESGADLVLWKMGSGKTSGTLMAASCRPGFDRVTVICGLSMIDYWSREVERTGKFLTFLENPARLRYYVESVLEKRWAKPFQELKKSQGIPEKDIRAKLDRATRLAIFRSVFSRKSPFHPDSWEDGSLAFATTYEVLGYQEFVRSRDPGSDEDSETEEPLEPKRKRPSGPSKGPVKKKERLSREAQIDELACLAKLAPRNLPENPEAHRRLAIVDEPQKYRNGTSDMKRALESLQADYELRILATGTLFVNDVKDAIGIVWLFDGSLEEDRIVEPEELAELVRDRVSYYDMEVHHPELFKRVYPSWEQQTVTVPMSWVQTFQYMMAESLKVRFMGYTVNTPKSNHYGMRTLMICNKPEGVPPSESPKIRAVMARILEHDKWPQVCYSSLLEAGAELIHSCMEDKELALKQDPEELPEVVQDARALLEQSMAEEEDRIFRALTSGEPQFLVEEEEEEAPAKPVPKKPSVDPRLQSRPSRVRSITLTGKTKAELRQKIVDDFSSGFYDLLCITDVGSTSLDVGGGAQAMHIVTPPQNAASKGQIVARVARIHSHRGCGARHVIVYDYVSCFPRDQEDLEDLEKARALAYETLTKRDPAQAGPQLEKTVPLEDFKQAMLEYVSRARETVEQKIVRNNQEKVLRTEPYVKALLSGDRYDPIERFSDT